MTLTSRGSGTGNEPTAASRTTGERVRGRCRGPPASLWPTMLPHELDERRLRLPETADHRIAIVTGTALRHRRFAYRIQQEFGSLVAAWFELGTGRQEPESQRIAEDRLFQSEVQELRDCAVVRSTAVADPNARDFVQTLRELDPYFLLSLGGPLYRPEVLDCARGIALNQHAGWSPTFRGSNTVGWALYHRQLGGVGTTAHSTTAELDGGPIPRRSQAALS